MLKARTNEKGIQVFDPYTNSISNFTSTTWEIIQALKKYGAKGAVAKIMQQFNIDEHNAEEDVNTVLANLKTLDIALEELPAVASDVKYAPRTVHIDITPRCNSNCIYCYALEKMTDQSEMSTLQVINIINQLPELGTWLLCISGGEPLLRKDIFKILGHIEKQEIAIWFLTNGMLINEQVAEQLASIRTLTMIQLSLDSCVPEHHDFHRGVKHAFEKTTQGIENLVKYNITPEIEMVITHINLDDIEETIAYLYNLGVKKVKIGPALTTTGKGLHNKKKLVLNTDELKLTGERIVKLQKKYKSSMYIVPTREFLLHTVEPSALNGKNNCGVGQSFLYISPNGLVYPCIFSYGQEFIVGDAKKETLSHIWKTSSLLQKYRSRTVFEGERCKSCSIKYLLEKI